MVYGKTQEFKEKDMYIEKLKFDVMLTNRVLDGQITDAEAEVIKTEF